jgi:hypothetical protein
MKQKEKADLEVQELSNSELKAEFLKACKKLNTKIEKNGYQIRFPSPYNYLDKELATKTQMRDWFKTQAGKYRNWDPPIERIEGRSGDLLLMYIVLNNDKLESEIV